MYQNVHVLLQLTVHVFMYMYKEKHVKSRASQCACIVWEFANIDAHILRTLYGIEWIEDICHIGPYITEQ